MPCICRQAGFDVSSGNGGFRFGVAVAGLILWTLQAPNGKGNKGLIQTFSFANSGWNAQ
jgi:hypothetical protein